MRDGTTKRRARGGPADTNGRVQPSGDLAAAHSERRLRAVLDAAIDSIITIDSEGTIVDANRATTKTFGYRPAQLIGRNVSMLMPEPYRGEHDGYLATYLKTGEKKIIGIGREVVAQRKDGSVFPADLAISEMRSGRTRLFDLVAESAEAECRPAR